MRPAWWPSIRIKMGDVHEIKQKNEAYFVDTGSPHLVMLHHDLQNLDVVATGRAIRYDKEYQPHGTNVNFIEPENDEIHIRTYERGVENETLSCGTGSVAAAISLAHQRQLDHGTFIIRSPGGRLSVSFEKDPEGHYKNIWLEGPASEVFSGQYNFNPSKSKLKYL